MKKICILVLSILAINSVIGQSRYTVVQLNKKDVPGIIGEIPFVENTVREAINKNFEKLGYKAHKVKDYYVYGGVFIKDLDSTAPHDLYVMVDRKSRSEKEVSVVTILIGKGFDSFASDTADAALINNSKIYLNNLREVAAAYDLELQISAQEDIIKRSLKKVDGLAEDASSLQKKKKKLDEEIAQNAIDHTNQKADADRQKQILETLKNKRKTAN